MTEPSRPAPAPWRRVLTVVVALIYPGVVYLALTRLGARGAALVVLALVLPSLWLRATAQTRGNVSGIVKATAPTLVLIAATAVVDDPRFLLALPVLINVSLLVAFAATLRVEGPSMIERFARLQEPDLPPGGIAYCRAVTKVWCGFFVLNAAAAAVLAIGAPVGWWALYNGVIAYGLMGMLFAAEYVVRKVKFRRYRRGPVDRLFARLLPTPPEPNPK